MAYAGVAGVDVNPMRLLAQAHAGEEPEEGQSLSDMKGRGKKKGNMK